MPSYWNLLTLQEYNGICKSWNYQLLLQFFGADVPSRTFSARKREELDYLLTDKVFNKADVIQVPPPARTLTGRWWKCLWTSLIIPGV